MNNELKFKPGDMVRCIDVKDAGGVGYIGTYHTVCDYANHPNYLKYKNGEPLYLCESLNGYFNWFYETELKGCFK